MSAKMTQRPAPKSSAGASSPAASNHQPRDAEQYQSARGCLMLIGIGFATLAAIILLALLLGNFN